MIDKRREERVHVVMPVFLAGAIGSTNDVSASGMFFETCVSFSIGEPINFKVEFDAPGGRMMLNCSGEIVRTEQRDERIGVAVRIAEAAMEVMEN